MTGWGKSDCLRADGGRVRPRGAWGAVAIVLFGAFAGSARSQDTGQMPDAAAAAVQVAPDPAAGLRRVANFRDVVPSGEARELAHWVVHSGDNARLPFIVVDKVQARVFVFDYTGLLRGATSALMGTALGDDSVPGIGERKLSTIRPHERTTPSGRFMAYLDRDIHGEEVLWVDYDTAVSLHRIVKGNPKERRAERLASPTPSDNRITYGCINVAVDFYDTVVSPLFQKTQGVVYVLPETRPARVVFNSYVVEEPSAVAGSAEAAPMSATAPVSVPVRATSGSGTLLTR